MLCASTTKFHSSGPITVETWPGATSASKPGLPESSSIATAGQVRRPESRMERLSGIPSASNAATGAVVVSKPAAKNTTWRSGFASAMARASVGLAMGRTSAPAACASASVRTSPLGTFTGTRSMSP